MADSSNLQRLFYLIEEEGVITKDKLLDKAKAKGIFKSTHALRLLVQIDAIDLKVDGGKTIVMSRTRP